ncbi:nuclear transport factor 2 family protein [Halocatena halophila]|uniref:nuclear transport factor 2 family protein n=1 Tax=Halocatena halophila TaxID=2814576 RepID=UPI002ED1F1FF
MGIEKTIQSYYKFVDEGDYKNMFSLFTDDIVYTRPGRKPLEGKEEFQTFYLEHRPIGESHHTVDTLYIDGDTAIVQGYFDGTLDGTPVSFGFADIHQFNDDYLITRRWTYTDRGTV